MPDQDRGSQSTEAAVQLALLQQQLESLQETVDSLQQDRDRALRWGIMVLGTAVISMAMWIFNKLDLTVSLPSK